MFMKINTVKGSTNAGVVVLYTRFDVGAHQKLVSFSTDAGQTEKNHDETKNGTHRLKTSVDCLKS